jgi:hypothetical protein
MSKVFTARALAASAAAATIVIGGTLPSAGAADRDRDHRDRAWVDVCQRIDRDHGRDRDDHSDFRGRYKVEDRRDTQYVNLRGRRDCERVEVRAGRIRVSVVREPRDTDLVSRDTFRFHIDRGDYARVTFRYEEDDDDHGYGGGRSVA